MKNKNLQGFTLLEILLVVAAIAILASIVIVAINPGKQLADTKNAQRRTDINTVLSAVYQYSIDNNGNLPSAITASSTEICKTGSTACTGIVDLSVLTNDEKYLVAMPTDPSVDETAEGTGYTILKSTNGRITVSAPLAEQGAQISATR